MIHGYLRRLFLTLSLVVWGVASWAQTPGPEGLVPDSTELRVLRQFYDATGGPAWTNRTNWLTGSTLAEAATWHGVTVSQGDVVGLQFVRQNLRGPAPAVLAQLRGLQTLFFNHNPGLVGPLPASWSTLPALTTLNLWSCPLGQGGPIPTHLTQLTQLQTLNLRSCGFAGPLPPALGTMTTLTTLELSRNAITGPIPPAWGQLRYVELAFTQITGPLPAEIGQWTELEYLSIYNARLTGSIPPQLGNLRKLQSLTLSNYYTTRPGQGNVLTGGLPKELGNLTSLTYLELSLNPFGGPIPKEFGQLKNLTFLELDGCRLTGVVPAELLQLTQLNTLYLGFNNPYDVEDPNQFTAIPNLSTYPQRAGLHLFLNANQLNFGSLEPLYTGPGQVPFARFELPPQRTPPGADTVQYTVGDTLRLERSLGGRRTHYQWERERSGQWQPISGATDSVLVVAAADTAAAGLYRVRATNDWVTSLTLYSKSVYAQAEEGDRAQLQALRELYEATDGDHWLNHQHWPSGEAAWRAVRSISECQSWYGLDVQQGKLRGVYLGGNNLRGPLPASIGALQDLQHLILRDNQLRGLLPASLGQLSQLDQLYLSGNAFTGLVPSGLGRLPVRGLGLNHNRFSGELPADLGQLARVEYLYLQHNAFSGPFPAALLACGNLRALYLGSNRFTGPVPAGLSQLRQLEQLGLDDNRFSGPVPLSLRQLPLSALYLETNQFTSLPSWVGVARVFSHFRVQGNYLDFGSLEPNFTGPGQPSQPAFSYAPQRTPGPADTVYFQHGAPVTATRTTGGQRNAYQWERKVGQFWTALPGQTSLVASLGTGSEALEGEYRVRVTNTWVPGITLYTKSVYLSQLPYTPLAENKPVEGDCPPLLSVPPPADRTLAQDAVNLVRTYSPRVALTELTAPGVSPTGSILRELWTGIDQGHVGAIPVQFLPQSTSLVTALTTPHSTTPNYGARFRGYLVPPTSGSYAFQIAGDDNCELWLSSSEDPAQKVRLAHVPGATAEGEWNKFSEQQSLPVRLVAGSRYYLEVLHKQGGDAISGHVAVRWQRPGSPSYDTSPIAGTYLAPYYPTLGVGPAAPVFYRALNLGGGSMLLDGIRFEAGRTAPHFTLQGTHFGDPSRPLLPPVSEPLRQDLIRTGAYNNAGTSLVLSLNQVPAGTYQVYAYVWEDDAPQTLTFTLNGQAVLTGYQTGPAGTWRRLGPFTTTVSSAGTLTLAGSGGEAVVSALEVWRQPVLRPKEELQIATQYLDGLGRPVQSVQRQASPTGRDVVQLSEYDALGRESKQFLPYSATGTPQGAYRPDARREQHTFYAGGSPDAAVAQLTATLPKTAVAYAETGFEPSPLNRVLAQASPGESWSMSQRPVTMNERPNVATDSVRRWQPGYNSEREDLVYQGFYAPGELWVKQSQDEQKQTAREFTDKEGRVVLKQVAQVGGNTPSQWLSTYYVTDDFGRVRAVLPPKATQLIRRNNGQVTGAGVERLLFRYHYDAQGRLTEKQIPDQAGYQYTVYDALDRPILTQDVTQQAQKEWVTTKYDALGRVVYTALVRFPGLTGSAAQQRQTLQQQADEATTQPQPWPLFETPNASPQLARAYYSDVAFPRLSTTSAPQLLSVNYYDSYDFDQNGQADATYQAPTAAALACAEDEVPPVDLRVTGQLTRSQVRVLGQADTAPGAWLTTTSFFDEKLRPIQVVTTNARGGADRISTRFDFLGQALTSYTVHTDPGQEGELPVREQRLYDHAGRLLTLTQELQGAAPQVLARHTYNELGQLEQKQLGGTLPLAAAGAAVAVPRPTDPVAKPLQRVDYRYNVRGWLTGINDLTQPELHDDLWSFALSYDCGFVLPQYNGNIAGQRWRSAQDGIERAYGYRYDDLSRLVQGDFVARAGQSPTAPWTAEKQNYRFWAASYDAGGNLLSLRRRGLVQAGARVGAQYAETDNLRYRYAPAAGSPDPASNRLLRVDDLAPAATAFGPKVPQRPDFTDGTTSGATTPDYSYDAAGALTSDRNKGISSIRYNFLHLPERIEWSNGNALEYRYAASGQKVAKLAFEGSQEPVQTDYAGGWQYEGNSLRWFTHSEGRALVQYRKDAAGQAQRQIAYEYTLKDHLGNLRVAFRPGERTTYVAMLDSNPDQLAREQQQFDSVSVSYPIRQVVGRQFAAGGDGVALLNAGGPQPRPLGPLKQLVVSRGDTVDVTAVAMYQQPVSNSQWSFLLASFVASQLQQQPATLPSGEGSQPKVRVLPLLSVGLAMVPAVRQLVQGVPNAYVRVLVYNQDSVLVDHQEVPLSLAARENYERLHIRVRVPQAGYVQAYVANESDRDVFFDNVTVEHRQGLQVQENHYDPFGLDLVGLSRSPGLKGLNQYSWNGKEKQVEFGLNWHDHGWRFYDPALGRWVVTDPDAEEADQESWTTYQFGMDNAVRFNDLDGRQAGPGITMPYYSPYWAIGEVGLGVMQTLGGVVDKFSAIFSTSTSTETAPASGGTVLGTGVKRTSTIEVKSETTYKPTVKNYMTPTGNSNKPTNPAYKASTTVKVSKVEKIEGSGKYSRADIKGSTAVKYDINDKTTTAVLEGSAGTGASESGSVAATGSVETNNKNQSKAKVMLKAEYQSAPKTKISHAVGVGFTW